MNTFSTSPHLTLSMARYTSTEPAQQAQARATLRALRAEQRRQRHATGNTWNPLSVLARKLTSPAPASPRPAH